MNEQDNIRLRTICEEAIPKMYRRYNKIDVNQRLEEELQYIRKQEYAAQFLAYYDLIENYDLKPWQYILLGCGPSMLVCRLLGLSHVDPLHPVYRLDPEFFMIYRISKKPINEMVVDPLKYDEIMRDPGFDKEYYSSLVNMHPNDGMSAWTDFLKEEHGFPGFYDVIQNDKVQLINRPEVLDYLYSSILINNEERELIELFHPATFDELIRVYGLAHSSGVWKGNGKDLIYLKKAGLNNLIIFREDVYHHLMEWGVQAEDAFEIAEEVRKGRLERGRMSKKSQTILADCMSGKIRNPQMKLHGFRSCNEWLPLSMNYVFLDPPEWYEESLQKVSYLFPYSHAAERTCYILSLVSAKFACN